MRKKLLTLLLAVAASIGTMFAWDYERVQIGDLYYNLDATNQTAEVTSQNSSYPKWSTIITTANIPASVEYNSVTYSVTSIGDYAFDWCTGLTSVTIPNSVTSIGDYTFYGCYSLTALDVATDNPNYCSEEGVLFSKDKTTLIQYPGGKQGAYAIPNSVTSIGSKAFYHCTALTSVTIPNSVTSIGDYAFAGCGGLTSVTIPNSVTSIGMCAFESCSGLTSVTIPNSVTSIGMCAFESCSSLTSITIPNSVTSIGISAFKGCTGLTSVTIPNSVTSIGFEAFRDCSSLTSVTIPNSVTSIGGGAFHGCSGLTSVTIPNSVTSIGEWAFENCYSLTSIEIPNSVTSIGTCAFNGCTGLTSVTIPNSVTSIGYRAFAGCTGLTSVTIPNSVTSIGYKAFDGCSGLTSLTCEATTPPTLEDEALYSVDTSIPLYVPAESIDLYKAADQWKDFTNILPIPGTEPKIFTITWQDEEGNVIKTDEVAEGATPEYTGATPVKDATAEYTYEFAGWLPKIKAATKDVCYTTFFERNKIETPKYTVNINGENCSLHISNEVPAGTTLQVEAVADECFQFQKWSDNETANPRTINVTEDANLTAEFNKLQYTITGKNDAEGGQVNVEEVNP